MKFEFTIFGISLHCDTYPRHSNWCLRLGLRWINTHHPLHIWTQCHDFALHAFAERSHAGVGETLIQDSPFFKDNSEGGFGCWISNRIVKSLASATVMKIFMPISSKQIRGRTSESIPSNRSSFGACSCRWIIWHDFLHCKVCTQCAFPAELSSRVTLCL